MLKDKAINSNIGWDTKKNLNKKIQNLLISEMAGVHKILEKLLYSKCNIKLLNQNYY